MRIEFPSLKRAKAYAKMKESKTGEVWRPLSLGKGQWTVELWHKTKRGQEIEGELSAFEALRGGEGTQAPTLTRLPKPPTPVRRKKPRKAKRRYGEDKPEKERKPLTYERHGTIYRERNRTSLSNRPRVGQLPPVAIRHGRGGLRMEASPLPGGTKSIGTLPTGQMQGPDLSHIRGGTNLSLMRGGTDLSLMRQTGSLRSKPRRMKGVF